MVEQASIEFEVAELLLKSRLTLATAESSAGGLLGDMLTNIAGSSGYFLGGVVVYSYSAKTILLDISPEFLLEHDSVSRPVALAMARNIRARMNADVGLAETCILGPGGSSTNKPVGSCFIAIAAGEYESSRHFVWNGDRISNKRAAAIAALTLLKEYLLGHRDLHP